MSSKPITDAVVCKYTSSGSHIWSDIYGSPSNDSPCTNAVDSAGGVYVGGYYASPDLSLGGQTLPYASGNDAFVVKFDIDGNHQWSHGFGGSGEEVVWTMSAAPGGGVVAGGWVSSATVDLGGGPLPLFGVRSGFIVRYNASGAHLWSVAFGGESAGTNVQSIAVGSGSEFYVGVLSHSTTLEFMGETLQNAGQGDVVIYKMSD